MRFVPQIPSQFTDKNNKNSAKAQFLKNMQKGSKKGIGDVSAEDRYQDMLQSKLEETRAAAMKGASYTFHLAGTDPTQTRQLSKGAQEVIEKMAEKKAKQAAKKAKKADIVSVRAKYFTGMQGGRIDKSGKIYNAQGKIVLTVDLKTGKIKNGNGNVVGNYDPNSTYSEHRICELIAKHSTGQARGIHGAPSGHGEPHAGGNIWGKSDSSAGNGSIWGSGGGNIWGSSNDSGNSSGWW